jgi:hypothetical protein
MILLERWGIDRLDRKPFSPQLHHESINKKMLGNHLDTGWQFKYISWRFPLLSGTCVFHVGKF